MEPDKNRNNFHEVAEVPIQVTERQRILQRQSIDQFNKQAGARKTIIQEDENSLPSILIGYQENGFGTGKHTGIKVAQQGKNVETCSDDELVMSSEFNSFKITDSGAATLVIPAVGASAQTIEPHSLGYVPMIMMFLNIAGYGYSLEMPYIYTSTYTGHMEDLCNFEVNDTNIYINWKKFSTSAGLDTGVVATFKWYAIREIANA